MKVKSSGKNVFRELEAENPAIAQAFRTFRRRGQPPPVYPNTLPDVLGSLKHYSYAEEDNSYPSEVARTARMKRVSPIPAFILLFLGVVIVAIVIGPTLVRFLALHWQAILIPVGSICVGAGAVLLGSRLGSAPLRDVTPPKANAEDPLQELKDLAERTAARLQTAYRLQLWAVLVVGVVFIALIAWSAIMVSQNRLLYASAFGSGSIAMLILTQWKWQPFDRINQARRLADNADTLATGLRLRMKTISEIVNPTVRAKAQWDAVEEYLKSS